MGKTGRNRREFVVRVPDPDGNVRRKLECLAEGSMRGLGPTVAILIAQEDVTKPEWNRRPMCKERTAGAPDLVRPSLPQGDRPHA